MIRIAVLSDTHDWYPADLPERLRAADEIWHLGDVCEPEVLEEFYRLGKPLHVVMGNNEDHHLWPGQLRLDRLGRRFFLTHIPPGKSPPGIDVVLHGHTHVPRDETDELGVRWLNPGSVTGPRGGSMSGFGWLELELGQPIGWRRELL